MRYINYTYRNEEYGFELALDDSYKDYSTETRKPEVDLGGEIYLTFQVNAANYNWPNNLFPIFTMIIYPADWWNKNAEIDKQDSAWIKGVERDLGSHLGIYISKNNNFAFAWTRGQDCPDELCGLYKNTSQILSTFKFISTSTVSVLPPDPGEAGKLTLEGIDSDKDGVRDDIQRLIYLKYSDSQKTREALKDVVKALQAALLASNNRTLSLATVPLQTRAANCLVYVRPDDDDILENLVVAFLNTEQRFQANNLFSSHLKGLVTTPPAFADRKFSCTFDPDSLPN